MLVDVLGYLLFASGLHLLLATTTPSDREAPYDGERRLRKSIYDQFIIGGNLNPRSTRESTPNKINDISLGSIKEPVSCNSQATTLMAKRKVTICQDDDQCAYRPQGVQCFNRTHGRPVESLKKIFESQGKANLMFENCNDHGFIKISLNNKAVQVTGHIAEFVYKKCDVLEVKEEEGAIIKISLLNLRRHCPTITGYVSYTTGGCTGRDELEDYRHVSLEFCQRKCNANPNCVSFEAEPQKKGGFYCLLSSSCTYDLSQKREGVSERTGWCFHEKQGSSGCQNKESYCEAAGPDCNLAQAQHDCNKYCGLCQSSSCMNKEPWCESTRPDCKRSFVKNNCKKFCGLCGEAAPTIGYRFQQPQTPPKSVDSGNANEYEEEIVLDMARNNAQKMSVGSAVQSPLDVLLGMESIPKIVHGEIIAGDSSNVRVTLLKKLPDMDDYTPKNPDFNYPEFFNDDEEYSIY